MAHTQILSLLTIRVYSLACVLTFLAITPLQASDELDAVRAKMQTNLADIPIDHLGTTPVPGVFEVISEGEVYYVDSTVSFLFDGSMVDLKGRKNLTQLSMTAQNLRYIDAIGEQNMLIYNSTDKDSTRRISVFTDLDCPYCARLHNELEVLTDAGVTVRYLLFPRAGLNTPAHKKLENVWCASDQNAELTAAKKGAATSTATCDNPVEQHFALGRQLGLTATPMIFIDDGQRINGYLDAQTLLEVINESEPLVH